MLPIRLATRRFTGGFGVREVGGGFILSESSGETEPLLYESVDLENPVALRLANCSTFEDVVAFYSRFSDTPSFGAADLLDPSHRMRSVWSGALSPDSSVRASQRQDVNQRLAAHSIRSQIRMVDGAPRLVLETDSLDGFMTLELAAAIEAGVTAVACDHCDKLFLIGPFTGRRSHARFCADKCRVAAMRARNVAKGAAQ